MNDRMLKVTLIQSVDRKLELDKIANQTGLNIDEILSRLLEIVETGTILDVRYLIESASGEVKDRLTTIQKKSDGTMALREKRKEQIINGVACHKSIVEMMEETKLSQSEVLNYMSSIVRVCYLDLLYLIIDSDGKLRSTLKDIQQLARIFKLERKFNDNL